MSSRLATRPNLASDATAMCEVGGARRDRTADLLRARQALSQLSYGPSVIKGLFRSARRERPTFSLLNEGAANEAERKSGGSGKI